MYCQFEKWGGSRITALDQCEASEGCLGKCHGCSLLEPHLMSYKAMGIAPSYLPQEPCLICWLAFRAMPLDYSFSRSLACEKLSSQLWDFLCHY